MPPDQDAGPRALERRAFDADFYLTAYADVAQAGVDPFGHFMDVGWIEGRRPNAWFSVGDYLAANPDLDPAANPFEHYLRHGRAEGRPLRKAMAVNAARLRREPSEGLNLLLISVHPVLEYDDIRLFESMGHRVFSLGFYLVRDAAGHGHRPSLQSTDWHRQRQEEFTHAGVAYDVGSAQWRVNLDYCRRFDAVIVHHNLGFLHANWTALLERPVIWRDIGQDNLTSEIEVAELRRHGLKVVRWSPVQEALYGYAGAEAVIRAAKDPDDWSGWTGEEPRVVTFANDLPGRPGLSPDFWAECASDLPVDLYGQGNDGVPEWRGAVDYESQRRLLRQGRAALVTGTKPCPCTLGFIEAWMTGTPVIHVGGQPGGGSLPGTFEADQLIEHGVSGFVVETVEEGRSCIARLLDDMDLARAISAAGRRRPPPRSGTVRARPHRAAMEPALRQPIAARAGAGAAPRVASGAAPLYGNASLG